MPKVIDKYKKLPVQVRASLWFFVCSFLQKGISTITTPIFTRLLNTSEYGQYNVFNSWLGIITIFVTLRLSMGVYAQGLVKFEEDRKKFSSSLQGLTLVLCLAWTGIYLIFKNQINNLLDLTTIQMLAMLLMLWATSVFEFWAAEKRVTYSYKSLVFLTLIVSLAKPIIGIIFVKLSTDKVTARILGLALVELVGYTFLFFIQMRRGKQFYSAKYWKYAVLFNLPLIPHYLSLTVLNSSDRIMIKNMVGESESGIYSLAYSLAMIMTLVNTALSSTISPWMYQKIKAKRVQDIARIAYITLFIIAAANIILIAFAPEAVAIFAPKEYYDAIYCIPPVALSVFFMFCYDLFAKFEFYYEKTHYIMIASIIGALANIGLNYIFIKAYGYIAAAYTTLFCYVFFDVMHYIFMRKVCKDYLDDVKVYDMRIIVCMSVAFSVLGFAYLATYKFTFARYGLTIILIAIAIIKRRFIKEKLMEILSLRKKS